MASYQNEVLDVDCLTGMEKLLKLAQNTNETRYVIFSRLLTPIIGHVASKIQEEESVHLSTGRRRRRNHQNAKSLIKTIMVKESSHN